MPLDEDPFSRYKFQESRQKSLKKKKKSKPFGVTNLLSA